MLFQPSKVPLKEFSIPFKVFSAYCVMDDEIVPFFTP